MSAPIEVARDVRRARAAWKRQLGNPELTWAQSRWLAAELVRELPKSLAGMRLRELLLACRGIGKNNVYAYARAIKDEPDAGGVDVLDVVLDKCLGELTGGQRTRLVAVLTLDLGAWRRAS